MSAVQGRLLGSYETWILAQIPLKREIGLVQWLTPIIPALCEAKEGGSLGHEFETSLTNIVKPHLYKKFQLARRGGAYPRS